MIIINTPHNPVGKVFTREELEGIAKVAEDNNLLVMSDEVVRKPSLPLPMLCRSHVLFLWHSMIAWSTTGRNTSDSRISPECGTALSPWGLQEVSGLRFHGLGNCTHSGSCRGIRCHWVACRVADWAPLHHRPHPGCHYAHSVLHKLAPAGGGGGRA